MLVADNAACAAATAIASDVRNRTDAGVWRQTAGSAMTSSYRALICSPAHFNGDLGPPAPGHGIVPDNVKPQ